VRRELCYIRFESMETYSVRSEFGTYPVVCGRRALRRLRPLLARLKDSSGVFVVSSRRAWPHCGTRVAAALRGGRIARPILFNDAESAKNLESVAGICRELSRAGADRRCVIVAVGGGVVGDVAGFAAATYLRGVRLVHVPTTLVAQVDSAIGGKTGVNLPEGKNLVGAFYPPQFVVIDPQLLRTVPARQFRSALYEVIKYGVIGDVRLFRFLERDLGAVLRRDPKALDWIIRRCVGAKAGVVSKDEKESGLRQILNFGHTFGHALEAATKYRRLLHGEAVGWGMLVATFASLAMRRIGERDALRIAELILKVGPLPGWGGVAAGHILESMKSDKKAHGGRVRWVLPSRVGKVEWGIELAPPLTPAAVREIPGLVAAIGDRI
jgi:3-dehydroquinate synthase